MMDEYDIETDPMGTMVFCITENRWRGSDEYESDGLANTTKDAYSFKNGELWKHNIQGASRNLFYGEEVISRIGVMSNAEGGKIKIWLTASVEGNMAPTNATFRTSLPKAQNTRLRGSKFKLRNGVAYAPILRDGTETKLFNGKRLNGPFMYCLFEFDTREPLELRGMNIGYKLTAGHEFI